MTDPILVTGATGLVGQELIRTLSLHQGSWQIHTASRSESSLPGHHRCDLSRPEECIALIDEVRPAAVVHLAGGTSMSRHELYENNVLSTVNLMNVVGRLERPAYCIVFGSAAEYGETSLSLIGETAPLKPVSEYGRAKVAQTTLAESIARARGIPLTILRPFNLVSPRLPPTTALGNMRRQLLSGEGSERTVTCGRLDLVRDYVPVSAVAEVTLHLLAKPAPDQILNVCSGVGISLSSILEEMAKRLGVILQIAQTPELLGIPAAPRAVGDPARLAEVTGIRIAVTAETLAEILVG
ncbi:MAG TPA: NAD-dependent epimerase/dehydratase family protein [Thermoanaerobaculia bacterium]|jgi:GDP-4-dehydro-6-deoxy-D-mannose reductase|nr:NAD-dependent epimerase/dehydratase family protein [Thermoanaerobaculia bacterium]